jgi:hypothetical protein
MPGLALPVDVGVGSRELEPKRDVVVPALMDVAGRIGRGPRLRAAERAGASASAERATRRRPPPRWVPRPRSTLRDAPEADMYGRGVHGPPQAGGRSSARWPRSKGPAHSGIDPSSRRTVKLLSSARRLSKAARMLPRGAWQPRGDHVRAARRVLSWVRSGIRVEAYG